MTNPGMTIPVKTSETGTFTLAVPPKPVGYWVLYPNTPYQTRFAMYARPTDEQIKATETLLGWGWEDAK